MALSKASILKHAGSFDRETVHVPKWADEHGDDAVVVRGMTAREFELLQSRQDKGEASASVLSRCIIDDNGGRIFNDGDVSSIAELGLAEVNRIMKVITTLSGLGDDEDESERLRKEIRENLEATTPDSSSSA